LATVVSHFATLTVGNISHHIFKMDILYSAIKYCGLVKTRAHRSVYWNKRPFANKCMVKLQMHINRTCAVYVNQSLLGQAVFKIAAFRLDASMKTGSPLPDCRVSDMLVEFTNHPMQTQCVTLTQ